MKKTYLLVAMILLLIGVVSSAGVWRIPSGTAEAHMMLPVAGGVTPDAVEPSSYDFENGFEGTGAESIYRSVSGYSAPNYDYSTSPAPLDGSESCLLEDTGTPSAFIFDIPTPGGVYYIAFELVPNENGDGKVNSYLVDFLAAAEADNSTTTLCRAQLRSDGTLRLYNTGGTTATGIGPLVDDTHYYMMIVVSTGTGANAAIAMYLSTDVSGGWGSVDGASVDGSWTTNAGKIRIIQPAGWDIVLDSLIGDSSSIPSSEY